MAVLQMPSCLRRIYDMLTVDLRANVILYEKLAITNWLREGVGGMFVRTDLKTMIYIRSETEFNRARMRGVWDVAFSLLVGDRTHLLSFDDAIKSLSPVHSNVLGLRDIPLDKITGSMEREQGFSRHFFPRFYNQAGKERWRSLYTLVITGAGMPPVELYKIGGNYFVKDGHYRVSVAKYLDWETIQAQVIELSAS
jgi:hypothetical protein